MTVDSAPAIIVSSDTHVGPRMDKDLRAYCPKDKLGIYDEYLSELLPIRDWWYNAGAPNGRAPGHWDSAQRARDCERDGVVAEVLFHFSFNGELIPFAPLFLSADRPTDLDLAALGYHIYNQWLADFCNDLPGRRVGLTQIPIWDVDACVKEVEWAADAGLRGVNLPAQRESLPPYDDEMYEPLWAACAANDMPLTTHAGAASPASMVNEAVVMMETGGVMCRRAIHRFIFGGQFDRYPNLKLVMTEQPGLWQPQLMAEMDSIHNAITRNPSSGALIKRANSNQNVAAMPNTNTRWNGSAINTKKLPPLPKPPSEYFKENVFVGASFMAHFEAVAAIENDLVGTMMWGSDYPHPEGCWKEPESDDEPSQLLKSLQMTFEGLAHDAIRAMVGENAIRCYGLDRDLLAKTAAEIGAPTPETLASPPQGALAGSGGTGRFAFRTEAFWF